MAIETLKLNRYQCSKFSAEGPAQLKKLDGADGSMLKNFMTFHVVISHMERCKIITQRIKNQFHNFIVRQFTYNKSIKIRNGYAKRICYISAPEKLSDASKNLTAQRRSQLCSLNTELDRHFLQFTKLNININTAATQTSQ